MILRMAWRNIWRNKLRSVTIMVAVALGLTAGVFASAMINGMMLSRFQEFIENQISHLQLHHPDFVGQQEVYQYTGVHRDELQKVLENPMVRAATVRTKVHSMIASATYTGGVELMGVLPEQEKQTTGFHNNVVEGSYLEKPGTNEVLLGSALAEKMRVQVGSRVVLTFQDVDHNMVSAAFVISGLYETGHTRYDESFALVHIDYLNNQVNIGESFHEMALLLTDIEHIPVMTKELEAMFPGLHVRAWNEVSPEMSVLVEAGDVFSYIFLVIILLGLAFGLLNTMLMAVYERTREIGMMMAVGMNKQRIFALILFETLALSLVGGLFGVVSSWAIVSWVSRVGIDLSAFDDVMKEIGFSPVIYPLLEATFFLSLILFVMLTALIASIYPSLRAMRLNPAESAKR